MTIIFERDFRFFCIYCFILFLPGCSPYKIPTQNFSEVCCQQGQGEDNPHWLYNAVPRHRSQIRWHDAGHWGTWMLFGNDDDGIFGEEADYRPECSNNISKAARWWLRNPLHNFCFYVIGTAYCTNSEITILKIANGKLAIGKYKKQGDTTFASNSSSFYLGLHGWKPFCSLRLAYGNGYTSDFYAGWRPRGNFGLKCIFLHKNRDEKL